MATETLKERKTSTIAKHKVVSQEVWLSARKLLLKKEKAATRARDALSAARRKLPWVKVQKNYVFDTPTGRRTLAELFEGRTQLVVYHFMFGPDWKEGCPSCSFVSDHMNATVPHLAARDVTLTMISRASLAKIDTFKKRMGWRFNWVSSHDTDFNRDFHVSFDGKAGEVEYNYTLQEFPSQEAPGLSVFYRGVTGDIFHTYSTFARGLEPLVGAYVVLDMVPKGRDEDFLDFSMAWVRYHDAYGTDSFADVDKPYWPEAVSGKSEGAGDCCREPAHERPK